MYYVLTHGYSTGVILTHLLTQQVNVYISVFAPIFLMHQYDPARILPFLYHAFPEALHVRDQVIKRITEAAQLFAKRSKQLFLQFVRTAKLFSRLRCFRILDGFYTSKGTIIMKMKRQGSFCYCFFSIIYGMKQTYLMHIFKDFDRDDCNFSITIEYYSCIIYLPPIGVISLM